MWSREMQFFMSIKREEARCAQNFFRASRSDARKHTDRGEISANAVRNSENPTEHLAAKYN